MLNFTKQLITVTHKPGFKDTEFIGGQNKSLIVICKELFLLSDPFKIMIHSYARVPDLARISPSVIAALSKASNNHSAVSLTIASASGTYKIFDLTFAGSQDKEENSKSEMLLFRHSPRYHHLVSESIEDGRFTATKSISSTNGQEFTGSASVSSFNSDCANRL